VTPLAIALVGYGLAVAGTLALLLWVRYWP